MQVQAGVAEQLRVDPADVTVSLTSVDGRMHWNRDQALEAAQRHGMVINLMPTRETYVYSA